jgi:hypothetical protein
MIAGCAGVTVYEYTDVATLPQIFSRALARENAR